MSDLACIKSAFDHLSRSKFDTDIENKIDNSVFAGDTNV